MSGIGGVACDIIRGIPQSLKPRVDTWETEGLDGYGAQTLGLGDSEFELTAIAYCANNASANAFISDCESLQGDGLITVVDDWGDEYAGILVKHVDSKNAKKPLIYNGNGNAVRVEVQFQMLST